MKVLVLPLTAMAAILIFSLWAGGYVQQQGGVQPMNFFIEPGAQKADA